MKPTILNMDPRSEIAGTEIFGPVLGLMHVDTIDEAIAIVNASTYGNQACLFTSSGAAARQFRYEARAGTIGINVGVAAPMAFFSFSGWNDSFFGDMHAQGRDAIEFYTEKKIVVERWPKEWSRQFKAKVYDALRCGLDTGCRATGHAAWHRWRRSVHLAV